MRRTCVTHSGLLKLVTALVVAGSVILLALAGSAGGYLYWGGDKSVGRADLNGGGVKGTFIGPTEGDNVGVAVNGNYLFFGDGLGAIGRARLNGSDVHPDLISIPQPMFDGVQQGNVSAASLAVEGAHLYWGTALEGIGRGSVDGGIAEPGFIKTEAIVFGIAVDANHIYWVTEHAIGRAGLNGSNIEPSFIRLAGPAVNGIVVAGGYIYWGSNLGQTIGRARLDGRGVDPDFITGIGYAGEPVVRASHIYWTATNKLIGPGLQKWIGRASLSGGDIDTHLINVTDLMSGDLTADGLGPGGSPPARRGQPSHRTHVR